MRLKPQPRPKPSRRPALAGGRIGRGHATPRRGARPGGRMARRPGVPLHQRIGRRLPSLGRTLAVLGAAAGIAATVALVNGPWLRVGEVGWEGARFTPRDAVASALEPERGVALLALDTAAAAARLEALPSVASAEVRASLDGTVTATIAEPAPAFVWDTIRARLLADAEGLVFAALERGAELPDGLEGLPRIDDRRFDARVLTVGDRISRSLLRTAAALTAVDPAVLGSKGERFSVRIDDDYGFVLISHDPEWEAAFGVFGLDPRETAAAAEARLEAQMTAVRTLFATRDEAAIGWLDVRNPGKVYFRARG